MKIELRNISHNERLSQETHAYSAALYIDGAKIGEVSNAGHGGCDMFYGDREAYKRADDWCRANLPKWGSKYDPEKGDTHDTDLEMVCGDLVNDHLLRKDMKKTMRSKILFIENGRLMQMGYRGVRKIEQAHLNHFRGSHPGITQILNCLPEDEALKLYKEHE